MNARLLLLAVAAGSAAAACVHAAPSCPPREDVAAVVEALSRAKSTRDGARIAGLYADPHDFADPTWETRTSRPAEMAELAGSLSRWETIAYRTVSLVVECDTAVVELEVEAAYKGRPVTGNMVSLVTVRDGKIVKQRDYFTTLKWSRQVRDIDAAVAASPTAPGSGPR